eukprot:TRINITY_DN5334_c1_g1_i1.p1 TRINITY_DN5334_c1_g1~~TRINITY_DN5334_c1_g1_i1.p1  ORF type:complete len:106 (+),score=4.59 TRINITY_DN5334_c1_g1_i1:703-1020(+)
MKGNQLLAPKQFSFTPPFLLLIPVKLVSVKKPPFRIIQCGNIFSGLSFSSAAVRLPGHIIFLVGILGGNPLGGRSPLRNQYRVDKTELLAPCEVPTGFCIVYMIW